MKIGLNAISLVVLLSGIACAEKTKLFDLSQQELKKVRGINQIEKFDAGAVYIRSNLTRSNTDHSYIADFKEPDGIFSARLKEPLEDFYIVFELNKEADDHMIRFVDEVDMAYKFRLNSDGSVTFGGVRYTAKGGPRPTYKIERIGNELSLSINGRLVDTVPIVGKLGKINKITLTMSSSTNLNYADKLYEFIIVQNKNKEGKK